MRQCNLLLLRRSAVAVGTEASQASTMANSQARCMNALMVTATIMLHS